jgi:hypothetical protein
VIFECVGAQNDQFVQEGLGRENAFELFMPIMNAHSAPARFLPFSCAMYEHLSGLTERIFAAPVVQAATAFIADSATERGLEVSAK